MREASAFGWATCGLGLLGLLLAGCQRHDSSGIVRIDFDDRSLVRSVDGWAAPERSVAEAPITFAWAQARTAVLRVELDEPEPRLVRVRAWPFSYDAGPQQSFRIVLNACQVGSAVMSPKARVYEFRTPRSCWRDGSNTVSFSFAYAEAPEIRDRGSSDRRTLAAAFDYLEIIPFRPS